MPGEGGCRIYDHRPRTCRSYDCRVFAATGIEPDQPLVAAWVGTWRFTGGEERAAVVRRAAEMRGEGAGATEVAVRAALDGL